MRFRLFCMPALALAATALAAPVAEERIADDKLPAWADARIKERQPRPEERRLDEIGWAKDIRAARKLSKEHNRPVFLFTMKGRITIGRC